MEAIVNGVKVNIPDDLTFMSWSSCSLLFVYQYKVYSSDGCNEDGVYEVTDEDIIDDTFRGWREYEDEPFLVSRDNIHLIFKDPVYIRQTVRRFGGVY